jgi:hypothetical protein
MPFCVPLPAGGWAVQAGTAVSSRVRSDADNPVKLIRIAAAAAERAVVERWDDDPAPDAFVQRQVHRLLRSQDRANSGIRKCLRYAPAASPIVRVNRRRKSAASS